MSLGLTPQTSAVERNALRRKHTTHVSPAKDAPVDNRSMYMSRASKKDGKKRTQLVIVVRNSRVKRMFNLK